MALTKGELTKAKLLDAAYRCISRDGSANTTFQSIADEAGVSQPLVAKVFRNKANVFPEVIVYKLSGAVGKTEEAMARVSHRSAQEQLETYVKVSVDLFFSDPKMPRFYMALYNSSVFDERVAQVNRRIREGAIQRIQTILSTTGLSPSKKKELAYMVHSFITGLLLNMAFECPADPKKQIASLVAMIRRLLP